MGDYHGKVHKFSLRKDTPQHVVDLVTMLFNGPTDGVVVTDSKLSSPAEQFIGIMQWFFSGQSASYQYFMVKRITVDDAGIHFEGYGSSKEVDTDCAVKFYESIVQYLVPTNHPLLRTAWCYGGHETSIWLEGGVILLKKIKLFNDEWDSNHLLGFNDHDRCKAGTWTDPSPEECWDWVADLPNPYINGSATKPKLPTADRGYGYYMNQIT